MQSNPSDAGEACQELETRRDRRWVHRFRDDVIRAADIVDDKAHPRHGFIQLTCKLRIRPCAARLTRKRDISWGVRDGRFAVERADDGDQL